jgi:uncharacterized protein (UPF0276 family)
MGEVLLSSSLSPEDKDWSFCIGDHGYVNNFVLGRETNDAVKSTCSEVSKFCEVEEIQLAIENLIYYNYKQLIIKNYN